MKVYRGIGVQLHSFSNSVPDADECSTSPPSALALGKNCKRLGGPHSRSGRSGEEEFFFLAYRASNQGPFKQQTSRDTDWAIPIPGW